MPLLRRVAFVVLYMARSFSSFSPGPFLLLPLPVGERRRNGLRHHPTAAPTLCIEEEEELKWIEEEEEVNL